MDIFYLNTGKDGSGQSGIALFNMDDLIATFPKGYKPTDEELVDVAQSFNINPIETVYGESEAAAEHNADLVTLKLSGIRYMPDSEPLF